MKQKIPIYVLHIIKTCILGSLSRHISAKFQPIRLKFGLWLVLMIILVPCIHSKMARATGTTLNMESTLTLTLLRRPLIQVGQMVSGDFLLTPWVICNWFRSWEKLCETQDCQSSGVSGQLAAILPLVVLIRPVYSILIRSKSSENL